MAPSDEPEILRAELENLKMKSAAGVGVLTIVYQHANGNITPIIGGNWGQGSAGLLLMQQVLEIMLGQIENNLIEARVQECLAEKLKEQGANNHNP